MNKTRDYTFKHNTQGEDHRVVMNITKMPLSELLPILKKKNFYKHPRPVSKEDAHKKDPSKWCDYHLTIGHITGECRALQRYVDWLKREGYLNNLTSEASREG